MAFDKSDQLKKQIIESVVEDFSFKIDDVLSMCDSEIEKLMLLNLFNYFKNYNAIKNSSDSPYSEIEFIEDEIYWDEVNEDKFLAAKVQKYNYRFSNPSYRKYIGFRVEKNSSEPLSREEIRRNKPITFQEFEIYPQFDVQYESLTYRLDVAIILKRKNMDGELIETRKIALECDGYDYHVTPRQKMNDEIRTRKLKKNKWKEVLRYSGMELYSIKQLNEMNTLFEDIVEILML